MGMRREGMHGAFVRANAVADGYLRNVYLADEVFSWRVINVITKVLPEHNAPFLPIFHLPISFWDIKNLMPLLQLFL